MCGIVGIAFNFNRDDLQAIYAMSETLHARGPDDSGVWINEEDGIAFGHRRLSIIDLSNAGHQPMVSKFGRFVMTYNGEIYNYIDIRNVLIKKGITFYGHSDTELILSSFEEWGVLESLKIFNGMFAFAVWDKKEKKLFLVRDRFGEKPLYYGQVQDAIIFGSELKALKKYKQSYLKINDSVIGLFLKYLYIPEPFSIYENIFKLEPGTIIEFNCDGKGNKHIYWSAKNEAVACAANINFFSQNNGIDELHKRLSFSIQQKCIADVPLGVFLSGGIDSSLITALMQEIHNHPVKTFTIGFNEKLFNNEAPYAKQVAAYLGTDHNELYVTEKDALDVVPKLSTLYDEPFADSSQIPTSLLCMFARKSVTVCLSGDGGDELFGGYNRYLWIANAYKLLSKCPGLSKRLSALMTENTWNFINQSISRLLPERYRVADLGNKIHKVTRAFENSTNIVNFYHNITYSINNPKNFLLSKAILEMNNNNEYEGSQNLDNFIHWMMLSDTTRYLPGDILTKVDRAAMGMSLEVRIPFLDPNVYNFAWGLPLSSKIKDGQNKYILRQLLYRYVPKKLLDRPKVGFGVPIGRWIKGSLNDWAENLLDGRKINQQGIFDANLIRTYWMEHKSGKKDWTSQLWSFLMFQAWLEDNG